MDSEPWSAGVSGIDKPKHHRGSSQSGSEHHGCPTSIATAASGAELFWGVAVRSSSSACSAWYRNDATCIGFANTASGSESIGADTCTGLADAAQGSTCGSESLGASSCKCADSGKAQACAGEEDAGCGKGRRSCSNMVRFGQGVISPSFEFAFRPCGRLHEKNRPVLDSCGMLSCSMLGQGSLSCVGRAGWVEAVATRVLSYPKSRPKRARIIKKNSHVHARAQLSAFCNAKPGLKPGFVSYIPKKGPWKVPPKVLKGPPRVRKKGFTLGSHTAPEKRV